MHFPSSIRSGLTLIGICAIGTAATHPAAAQELKYTLSGVTFSDGATAAGYFNVNTATGTIDDFDITTTAGVTDALIAGSYLPSTAYAFQAQFPTFSFYYNFGSTSFHSLALMIASPATDPGVYALEPGVPTATNQFIGSGEYAPTDRLVVSGSLIASDPAAVPEASTTVSFGLLLTLGGFAIMAHKKKSAH